MLNFIKSIEFLATLICMVVFLKIFGLDTLANYIQVFSVFQWSYIIYRLHRHHRLIESIVQDEDEEEC